MKLSVLTAAPDTLYTLTATAGPADLLLACLPDGTLVRSAFLHEDRQPAQIIAEWQRRYPRTVFTPAPTGFAADTDRGALLGTPFQVKVWQELAGVQQGQIVSYSWLAQAVGSPAAVRAVGAAVGANPLAPYIGCHRVLGKNGTLTGFAGGIPLKRLLLKAEGIAA